MIRTLGLAVLAGCDPSGPEEPAQVAPSESVLFDLDIDGVDPGYLAAIPVPDVDGDGIDDLFVSHFAIPYDGSEWAGRVSLVSIAHLGPGEHEITPNASATVSSADGVLDRLGWYLLPWRDVDADGLADPLAASYLDTTTLGLTVVPASSRGALSRDALPDQVTFEGYAEPFGGEDWSGDGVADVVIVSWDAHSLSIVDQPWSGTVAGEDVVSGRVFADPGVAGFADAGDVDGDGIRDVWVHRGVVGGSDAGLFLGPFAGDRTFEDADAIVSMPSGWELDAGDKGVTQPLRAGDLDDDGAPDQLLRLLDWSDPSLPILHLRAADELPLGSAAFADHTFLSVDLDFYATSANAEVLDLDGDGADDLVLTAARCSTDAPLPVVSAVYGPLTGTVDPAAEADAFWGASSSTTTGGCTAAGDLSAADLDGDGEQELVFAAIAPGEPTQVHVIAAGTL